MSSAGLSLRTMRHFSRPSIGRRLLSTTLAIALVGVSPAAAGAQATPEPTFVATPQPTVQPTVERTTVPTTQPTVAPTAVATAQPTAVPTPQPTQATGIALPDGRLCQYALDATAAFAGQPVTYACGAAQSGGTTVILGQPTVSSGVWSITVGVVEGSTLQSSQTLRALVTRADLADGTTCTAAGQDATTTAEGEHLSYTCGRAEEGLVGSFDTSNPLWMTDKVVVATAPSGALVVQERETLGVATVFSVEAPASSAQATAVTLPDGTRCEYTASSSLRFQGQAVTYTCTVPSIVLLGTPVLRNGVWVVSQGTVQSTASGPAVVSATTLEMDFASVHLLDGSTCQSTGQGAGVDVGGERVNYTCGDPSVGLVGVFDTTQPLWLADRVTLQQSPTGPVVQSRSTVGLGEAVGTTPAAPPAPLPPVVAPPTGQAAPPQARDERYFLETSFRVGNDAFWLYFQSGGAVETFGFPVSRVFDFLGCPVQIFQRSILQQCGQGAPVALLNLLDPELFPYTQVNGSTFPAPDDTVKAATPPVSAPNYNEAILQFVRDVAPDEFGGQPVTFEQTFFATGGLEIWGAPISNPAYDPSNANFVYQRYQRGIMHYAAGQGTRGILLADYLKAIMLGPELAAEKDASLPADLNRDARSSTLYSQYCPGAAGWLCRAADMPDTDLTFAFEAG